MRQQQQEVELVRNFRAITDPSVQRIVAAFVRQQAQAQVAGADRKLKLVVGRALPVDAVLVRGNAGKG